jgi:hypothetical protein
MGRASALPYYCPMDNLLTISDFTGRFNIPNKTGIGVSANLDALISDYQEQFLVDLLGVKLYKDFEAGMAEEHIEDKWTKLLNGDTITIGTDDYIYKGIKEALKAWLYFIWMANTAKALQGIGTVAPSAENGRVVSPEWSLTQVWNYMLDCRQEYILTSNYISCDGYITQMNGVDVANYPDYSFTAYYGVNPLVSW